MTNERLLRPTEVAERADVTPATVRLWIRQGRLEAVRLGEHGTLRVPVDALDRFLVRARDDR